MEEPIEIVVDKQMISSASFITAADATARLCIRRVYIIVCMQFICTYVMTLALFNTVKMEHVGLYLIHTAMFLLLSLSIQVYIMVMKYQLTTQTVVCGVMGVVVSLLVACEWRNYQKRDHVLQAGRDQIVLQAGAIVLTELIAFILLTFQEKIDFGGWVGVIIALCIWAIFAILFRPQTNFRLVFFGSGVFSWYIIFGTCSAIRYASSIIETGEISTFSTWKRSFIFAEVIQQIFILILYCIAINNFN